MKKIIFLLAILFSLHASAQRMLVLPDTPTFANQNRGVWVFRIADNLPYYSNGIKWIANTGGLGPSTISDSLTAYNSRVVTSFNGIRGPVKGVDSVWFTNSGSIFHWRYNNLIYSQTITGSGSGVVDSTVYATIHYVSTNFQPLGTYLVPADTSAKWLTAIFKRNDSVFFWKGGTPTFAFKDSTGTGSGAVSSVFGRTGTITAAEADYSSYYPLLSGSYNNPSWLNQLAWSKITGAPSFITNIPTDSSISLSNRIIAKQDKLTLTTTGTSGAATLVGSTLNIPQYSGSGGSADSSWITSETGIQPNMIGYLVNSTLGSLPSGWATVTPNATISYSGKMIVSGGTTGTAPYAANTGTTTVYNNRIRMDFYPYSKLRYAFTVVPQDKTSTSYGVSLHFEGNALFYSSAMEVKFNLSTSADSGRIIMNYDLGSTIAQSANLAFNATDSLELQVVKDFWNIKASMYNRRTGKFVDCNYYSTSGFGTGGRAYIGLLGGSQHITSAKVESYDLKNGDALTVIGDSQGAGAGATDESKTFSQLLVRGNKTKVSNLSNGSITLSAIVNSHVPAAIALNNPTLVIAGFNDRRDLVTDTTTYKTRLAAVVNPLVSAGLPVYVGTLVPTNQGLSLNYLFDIATRNWCAANGITCISIDSVLKRSGDSWYRAKENYLSNDGLHWSDSGQVVAANKVIASIGSVIQPLFKDTSSPVFFYNLPTGTGNLNNVGIDGKGRLYRVPQKTFDGILNARNYNGIGTIAQPAEIHISSVVKSDSALQIHNSKGLMIGFNGGSLVDTTGVGSNISITNAGVGGVGYPQRFTPFALNNGRNFVVQQLSTNASVSSRGNYGYVYGYQNFIANNNIWSSTITGNGNTAINQWNGSLTLGSSSGNVLIGGDAGSGLTNNANNNVQIISGFSTGTLPSSLSQTIILGTLSAGSGSGDNYQNNDIVFSTAYNASQNLWIGGRGNFYGRYDYTINPPAYTSTNVAGHNFYIRASRGSGNQPSGPIYFQSWDPGASGSAVNSTPNTELTITRDLLTVDAVLKSNFSIEHKYNSTSTGITLDNTYNVVEVTATGQTITLPTAVGNSRVYTIKLTASGSATVTTTSSQTIDGSTTYSLSAQYKYVTVQSNGTNWIIIGNN